MTGIQNVNIINVYPDKVFKALLNPQNIKPSKTKTTPVKGLIRSQPPYLRVRISQVSHLFALPGPLPDQLPPVLRLPQGRNHSCQTEHPALPAEVSGIEQGWHWDTGKGQLHFFTNPHCHYWLLGATGVSSLLTGPWLTLLLINDGHHFYDWTGGARGSGDGWGAGRAGEWGMARRHLRLNRKY